MNRKKRTFKDSLVPDTTTPGMYKLTEVGGETELKCQFRMRLKITRRYFAVRERDCWRTGR